ncbi:MAG TPA: hypothetical protein VJ652_11535 [Noviherbaspirillum sp.]|nr:hypothetical protein [Noviherbaspirillum sp.]
MQHYYVNKEAKPGGHHEVHVPRCIHLPEANDRVYLGAFISASEAMRQALSHYGDARGCRWCCNAAQAAQA